MSFSKSLAPTLICGLLVSSAAFSQVPSLVTLQPKIDKAINRGVDALLRKQEPDGTWGEHGYRFPVGSTALSTYTLLKSGLKTSHPAVQRALRYLEQNSARTTYGAACQLLAFEATHDRKHIKAMKKLLGRLLQWQKGGYGYPENKVDLSNTQYAALGLRAARAAGLKVPRRAILELIKSTLEHQDRPSLETIPMSSASKNDYQRKSKVAGFKYRVGDDNHGKTTGSMTTAGLGILIICRDLADGKLPRALLKRIDRSIEMGLAWMQVNWRVDRNPPNHGWHLYYLYGLERVGDLLRREVMAGHYWYREGAQELIKRQSGDGSWGGSAPTCFALLFLKRATWAEGAISGAAGASRSNRVYIASSEKADVKLRGAGNPKLSLWIDGFHKRTEERFKEGLRIEKVEYFLDGKPVCERKGDPSKPWSNDEAFGFQHQFRRCGRFAMAAKVTVKNPEPGGADTLTLESPLMIVEVLDLPDAKADEVGTSLSSNLLRTLKPTVKSSTFERGHQSGGVFWIADGRLDTAWMCKKEDKAPWLHLEFRRPTFVREIEIWPLDLKNGKGQFIHDKVNELEVRLNQGLPRPLPSQPDGEPIRIIFRRKTPIEEIEIRVSKRTPAVGDKKGHVGIAEVVLH